MEGGGPGGTDGRLFPYNNVSKQIQIRTSGENNEFSFPYSTVGKCPGIARECPKKLPGHFSGKLKDTSWDTSMETSWNSHGEVLQKIKEEKLVLRKLALWLLEVRRLFPRAS